MDNLENIIDDSIGKDPTLVKVIDTLDDDPNNKKKKKSKTKDPDKKPFSFIKKLLFTIVVLGLMGGVSYGLYYYLSLGTGKTPTSKQKEEVLLKDITIYLNESLSTSLLDYGEFNSIDMTTCSLNIGNVDNTKVGNYIYEVTCKNKTYSANVYVKERISFNIDTSLVYKKVNSEIDINEFVNVKSSYTYEFVDKEEVLNNIKEKGIYSVPIKVTNKNNNSIIVYAVMYVVGFDISTSLSCTGDDITNMFMFDDDNKDLNLSSRIYSYKITSDSEYDNLLKEIKDGKITYDNKEGYVLVNTKNNIIKIVNELTSDKLKTEYGNDFYTTYEDIYSYYTNTQNYRCSY